MKTEINAPSWSKINWTAFAIAIVGVLAAFDLIPADLKGPLTELVMILGPIAIMVWRTWFTEPAEVPVVYVMTTVDTTSAPDEPELQL